MKVSLFINVVNTNLKKIVHNFLGQYAVNEQLRLQTLNMYFGAAQQQQQQQQQNQASAARECG